MSFITAPFEWLLLLFYSWTQSYGLAMLMFALMVRLIMLPFQMKTKRSTMRMMRLQPRIAELQKKHSANQRKLQEEISKLYKEENVNPMGGCLWSLIPFPILIALYSVIRQPMTKLMDLTKDQIAAITDFFVEKGLYVIPEKTNAFGELDIAQLIHENFEAAQQVVPQVMDFNFTFLGMNLADQPSWKFFTQVDWSNASEWAPALGLFLIPILSAFFSWMQMKVNEKINKATQGATQQGAANMKSMMLMMPLMSIWIGFTMPGALGLYWIAGSVLAILQDLILNGYYKKIQAKEDEEYNARERARQKELEDKRMETERLRAEGNTERAVNTSKKKRQAQEKAEADARRAAAIRAERAAKRARLGLPEEEIPESQVGNRRYARGRAYVADRFENPELAEEKTLAAEAAEAEYAEEYAIEQEALAAAETEENMTEEVVEVEETPEAEETEEAEEAEETEEVEEAEEDEE